VTTGWLHRETPRYLVAALAGLAGALAHPTPGWAGLAWISPALLWFGSAGLRGGHAFRYGYVAGLVQFLVLLRWMRHIPFPVGAYSGWVALSGYCALFPAAWVWLGGRLEAGPGAPATDGATGGRVSWRAASEAYVRRPWSARAGLLVSLALVWVGLEYVRAHLLGGFPWAPLGASQWRQLPLIQLAGVTGVYGVSFLVSWSGLALGGAFLSLGLRPEARWSWTAEARLPLLVTLGVMGWGFWRVMDHRRLERQTNPETVRLALVQPSVPQTLQWDPEEQGRVFDKIEGLSRQALALEPEVLIWPEGTFGLSETNYGRMTALIGKNGPDWILGADDSVAREAGTGGPPAVARYNAAFLRRGDGSMPPAYWKRRLVPFGEFVPLARWLPFLRWLTPIGDGFESGDRPWTFRLTGGGTTAPVICFEDVFPHGIRDHVQPGVDFLLGLTNDGWFAESAAQWQHTASAVFRAVENGVALVRVCNNGITGWWDACGTPRDVLGLAGGDDVYRPGVLLVTVPIGIPRTETPYHRHGDVFAQACLVLATWRLVRTRRRPGSTAGASPGSPGTEGPEPRPRRRALPGRSNPPLRDFPS
jgi:apolipoprotein N-acyltransferase